MSVKKRSVKDNRTLAEYIEDEKRHWANIENQYLLHPINGGEGRILIKEDKFKSKYECTDCSGKGHRGEICRYCLGTKFENGDEEKGFCRDCTIGERDGAGKTLGYVPCTTCKGTGGLIDIPDENKRNTTMGNVLAISSFGINEVKVMDKVLFTNYTGSPFSFCGIELRICHEKDLLGIVKQLRPNVDTFTEDTFADLDNTGVPHE